MDTDSNYIAISEKRLEDIVRPDLNTEFEAQKKMLAGLGQVERPHLWSL